MRIFLEAVENLQANLQFLAWEQNLLEKRKKELTPKVDVYDEFTGYWF